MSSVDNNIQSVKNFLDSASHALYEEQECKLDLLSHFKENVKLFDRLKDQLPDEETLDLKERFFKMYHTLKDIPEFQIELIKDVSLAVILGVPKPNSIALINHLIGKNKKSGESNFDQILNMVNDIKELISKSEFSSSKIKFNLLDDQLNNIRNQIDALKNNKHQDYSIKDIENLLFSLHSLNVVSTILFGLARRSNKNSQLMLSISTRPNLGKHNFSKWYDLFINVTLKKITDVTQELVGAAQLGRDWKKNYDEKPQSKALSQELEEFVNSQLKS